VSVVFISYRRKDSGGHAGRLHEELSRRYGPDAVFIDIASLQGGDPYKQSIHDAVGACDVALVLIGESWTAPLGDGDARIERKDDMVRREVAAALEQDGVAVVPILVEEARLPPLSELPEDLAPLRGLQVCRLRNNDWKADVGRIFKVIASSSERSKSDRWLQALRAHPSRIAAGVLAVVLVVAAIALFGGGDDGGLCSNELIPDDARAELADAAGSPRPAEEGSVYYGTCGNDAYALAAFPNGTDGVFLQSGLHWVDLGPIAAEKCARVPLELLDSWRQNDC
jgi:hypothetical protein